LPKVGSVRAEARNGGSGAELFAFCHAEFISASLSESPLPARPAPPFGRAGKAGISESIYINSETILKRVQHRIQGDNIVFPQLSLIVIGYLLLGKE